MTVGMRLGAGFWPKGRRRPTQTRTTYPLGFKRLARTAPAVWRNLEPTRRRRCYRKVLDPEELGARRGNWHPSWQGVRDSFRALCLEPTPELRVVFEQLARLPAIA